MCQDLKVALIGLIIPDCLLSASQPVLADFHQVFPVVFLDSTGHLNLCADVTASTYKQVPVGS